MLTATLCLALALSFCGCEPTAPQMMRTVQIPDGEIDPTIWGKAYPEQYELWRMTEEPISPRYSKYKTGIAGGAVTVDKLSQFPYMALLFSGWGFGIEYNLPRGHAYMVRDQLEIDASRLGAGGVCLSCKSPYSVPLQQEMGLDYYRKPFMEVLDRIPENNRTLGVACIDCHDNRDMSLRISRGFTLIEAYKTIGVDPARLTRQEMRSAVCAQCHVTYNIPKDKEKKSVGLYFPWQNSQMGAITVENIIAQIRKDESVKEWTQAVTGYPMAFIRHPEYEFWTNNSVHYKAGASCADCHMPYTVAGVHKVSNHRVMSPIDADMRACKQCHAESPGWLRDRVFSIQDRTVSMMIRAGYATATSAKLIEAAHRAVAEGKTIDPDLYNQAKEFYEEAFYRSLFIGAENSVGFHNPPEGLRILGDAIAFATKAEALLRQALMKAGVDVPIKVDLEIMKYVTDRGQRKLEFDPSLELKDPMGIQDRFF
jgi:nitrite reductase (cytochrome c-552)